MEKNLFRRNNQRALGVLFALACFWACNCQSSTTGVVDGAVTSRVCAWPASFDSADSSVGQCVAAQAYLSCRGSNGGGLDCLSNNLTECPGPNFTPGVSYSNCENQCHSDEYALACGSAGPRPWPQPPAVCRSLPSGPGGGSISCCPCDS
jgi:hypothetical protein